ncbi:LCP family protein [Candidatus Gracilibacteria bacterium]|nr:LCP family protein [Candidatus Gracilibacteria bacterium]
MSNFTVKKLPHSAVKKAKNPATSTPHIDTHKKYTRKIIAITLVVLSLIFGINYVVQGVGSIRVGIADDNSSFSGVIFGSSGTASTEKKGIQNILIVGIGGAGHQAGTLADSIMLASLDTERQSITMISIPRDLYVSYGTGAGAGKINSLYPIGLSRKEGITPLANKVSEITGQSIHHYMVIDFTAFRYIVDALDGIEIDVTQNLYDKEYPDYNYGYTVFSVKKGLQIFNGETALRYARSRHSTNDMDRSRRQQQIINAIKTKSLTAGVIMNPAKITNIIDAIRLNINTDLTVADVVSIGSTFASIGNSNIHLYNIGDNCIAYTNCTVGSYLYSPSMAYFGGAWSLIPEGARINKLSYYDRIHRFVDFVFRFPGIHMIEQPIVVVHSPSTLAHSKNLLMEMRKIGINFDEKHSLATATGTIAQSHINIYWNSEYKIGIDPTSTIVEALKMLDMQIPVNIVTSNEYVTNNGPKIEIVLGQDYKDFFTFAIPAQYLPKIEMPSLSGTTVSGEKKQITPPAILLPKPSKILSPNSQLPTPGEWEQL